MQKIVVLDFGSQYTHLIANRIRRLNVYSEILSPNTSNDNLTDAKGIILSGGPSSVYDSTKIKFNEKIFDLNIPILGLCYGHQLIAHHFKGKVEKSKNREYGIAILNIIDNDLIFNGLETKQKVWMSHADKVIKLPQGFKVLGCTANCENAAFYNPEKNIFGLQFHPEVTHTENGIQILKNFVYDVCKCKGEWTIKNFIEHISREINEKINGKNIFILLSGGVDSTVAASLLEKAVGPEKIYGLHIDNGFMRKNESRLIEKSLKEIGFKNISVVDYSDLFFEKLKGIYHPEQKRKIIGDMFIKVAENELKKINLKNSIIAQGTIYPDTIETKGTKHAAKIKTHHNRVKIVQDMINKRRIIEPIKELYKDEVRELGVKLGLKKELVYRHPFPGPGLAVRCLCLEKEYYPKNKELLQKEINEYLKNYNLTSLILPIRSVGVQGDSRTYKNPLLLMGIKDNIGYNQLQEISTYITNNFHEINRVVFLLNREKIDNIGTKKCYLTRERINLLQEADDIAMSYLKKYNLYNDVWQMPVVLLPILVDNKESIVLRPVNSREAMTAEFSRLPYNVLKKMSNEIMKLNIGAVFYDITNKPPGTIEWE